ncbi:hypothetical protein Tco_0276933 [Tanacetum coccineum]
MVFGGNTRDLGSFGEETNKITDLHQIHEEALFTERGDDVAGIKRRRRNLSNDGVRDLATASGRYRIQEDLESSTYIQIDINYAASENLRGLSAEEARETIEDFGNEVVRVKIPSCMSWLDAYDEPLGDLDMMEDKVENSNPQSTSQILLPFEENTSPVTYPDEVEEIIGIPIKEIPNFNELEPQPQPLPSCPSLNISLGEERGPEPPIKPHSPNSFRMKVIFDKKILGRS